MKHRREKVFGEGRPRPIDRNEKARLTVLAYALSKPTEEGKHYGILTLKFVEVLKALLWGFHNAATGKCFPSYEAIAERAGCARSTVYEAINALERAGILTWVNRLVRVREWGVDLFGRAKNRWRVIRTSNAYTFMDPGKKLATKSVVSVDRFSSKSEFQTGTSNQETKTLTLAPRVPKLDSANPLHAALARWEAAVVAVK